MAGYENYAREAAEIESEMERKGIVLGIDWNNKAELRALAREALDHLADDVKRAAASPTDYRLLAKIDLFGLAGMMLKTMEESASVGMETHGGPAWKAFAQALWEETTARRAP